MRKVRDFFIRLKMGYRMFLRGFNSYSWESSEVYLDIAERLKICYDVFKKDENYCWCGSEDNNQMRKLRETIRLCEDLWDDQFSTKCTEKVMERYKPIKRAYKDPFGLYEGRKPIPDEMYSYFFKKACDKDRQRYETKKKRLHYLLSKGLERWST